MNDCRVASENVFFNMSDIICKYYDLRKTRSNVYYKKYLRLQKHDL